MAYYRPSLRQGVVAGLIVLAVVFVAVTVWPIVVPNPLGTPKGGANTSSDTAQSGVTPAQRSAESEVGKAGPANEAPTVGLADKIKSSSHPLFIDNAQRSKLRELVQARNDARTREPFEIMIGAAVPKQVNLVDLPEEASRILNGYSGDQYTMVQDKLVIVDKTSRRVVAIVPGIG